MITSWRAELEKRKGKKERVEFSINANRRDQKITRKRINYIEKAQTIIQSVAQQTQEQLEYRVSELVTLALGTVFDDPYDLQLNFEQKRGKTEAELIFNRDRKEINPLDESGGGPVDIASFALRISLWALENPRARNTIILDEPFRFVSRDLQPRASEVLKEISHRLGLQILMISHSEDLIESADKVFYVKKGKNKPSTIIEEGRGVRSEEKRIRRRRTKTNV